MNNHAGPLSSPWLPGTEDPFEYFLSRLSPKVRSSVDKHLVACEGDSATGFGELWKKLALTLVRLAPHAVEVTGTAFRFFILDGKYRRQVFVLEDTRKGTLHIYLPDIIALAQSRNLLGNPTGTSYPAPSERSSITLEIVNTDTKDLPDYCKAMLGWGRRALCATLTTTDSDKHVRIVERLCELAADAWKNLPAPAAT